MLQIVWSRATINGIKLSNCHLKFTKKKSMMKLKKVALRKVASTWKGGSDGGGKESRAGGGRGSTRRTPLLPEVQCPNTWRTGIEAGIITFYCIRNSEE